MGDFLELQTEEITHFAVSLRPFQLLTIRCCYPKQEAGHGHTGGLRCPSAEPRIGLFGAEAVNLRCTMFEGVTPNCDRH